MTVKLNPLEMYQHQNREYLITRSLTMFIFELVSKKNVSKKKKIREISYNPSELLANKHRFFDAI